MSTKYAPLQTYLQAQAGDSIPLSFAAIEDIIGAKLPPSARKHRPWWSNNPGNSVITKAWLGAGYRSEQVDMQRERLVFRRQPVSASASAFGGAPPAAGHSIEDAPLAPVGYGSSLYGCMKGMITVADDCDLTEPAAPDWGANAASAASAASAAGIEEEL